MNYVTSAIQDPVVFLKIRLDLYLRGLGGVCAVAMVVTRRLFAVAMLSGIYSLLSALFFVLMDAVDVAFTEAAVGAGISTVLMLSGMALASRREAPVSKQRQVVPLVVVGIVGAALFYASVDMPALGDPDSPANAYVGREYLETSPKDIDVPNIVTAVLASYRGFDTFGEVVVVFTAGLACLMLLGAGSMRGGRRVNDQAPPMPLVTEGPEDEDTHNELSAAGVREGKVSS
ncbi:MAG: DUF4040 domain-containing protein [Pseudomonadota bacterium]